MSDPLVDDLRTGDAAAFDRVYALYRARIFSFLYRLAGRRDLAEDLFQETFLKLARNATSLRADTELGAWLYTVARNQYRSHRRWAVLDAGRIRELADEPAADRPTPDEDAQSRGELSALERALAQLKPDHREVLLLVAVQGVDQEQAAKILGIGHDALRQRLSRARALLAERLAASDAGSARMESAS